MTRHEQWEAIRRGLAERDVPGPQGDIVDPRTKAFDTIDRWVDGLVEDPAEAAGSKEALHALYEKHVTPELERLQATLGRPDAVITPMLSEDNIDSLTTADMDLELLRELQMPAFAPAFDVRLGTDDMAPSFTVFVNNDGSYSVDDVLPVGDTDFFRSEEQQNDYFATVGQLRGAQTEGEMTLHRAMSPAEYQAWESGEEIPTGKFFTVHRSTQYGVDVAGEFPDLFTVQVNAADVVETDPGTFQTIRPTRLVNGVVTSEPPPEAPGPQADVVEPLTDGPASAHLDSTYDEWGDSLTEDEVQALYVWRLSYGMYRINDQLRNGEPGGEVEVPGVTPEEAGFHRFRRSWASATRDVTDVIESMDSAIAKAPEIGIASKMDVYRGITDVTEFLGDDPWAKIGNTVTDRGFVATSTEESTAFDYATSDNIAAILEIELPAGTKGAWLRSVTERRGLLEWDRQTAEANFEFVLPRGSTFYVDDVTESNDLEAGIVTVKMRYVPHGTDLTPKQEELLRDKWDDPPEPRGIHAGRGGAGGFTSDDGETTLTDLGREGEALFTQLTGGELLHPPGKGEQSPLDVKFDGLGFEVKTVNANATSFKATLKKHEMSAKEEFARQLNLDPALAIVVIDRDAGVAKVYYRRGLKGGRLSRNTGWTFMADVPLS